MTEAHAVRLGVILNDVYYTHPQETGKPVAERYASGELKIEIGESNWPKEWYSDPYFNVSVPLALEIALALPDVKVFKLYYWRDTDFHHVRFEYDGDEYIIQWYKVFVLYRKSDGHSYHACERWGIAKFFKGGRYKTTPHWHSSSKSFNPFEYTKEKEKQS